MPRLTDARKELRRTQIAEAAVRCFSRNGLERTSIADITAESGLSAGSIYAHYRNKADLVQAAARDVLARRADVLDAYAAADARPARTNCSPGSSRRSTPPRPGSACRPGARRPPTRPFAPSSST
ncbi:TetR/AcrR family transcriptional regulator [Streptacidiphilus monticola]